MNEPLRLRDDPAFLRETGCDLADEAAALEPPDLPRLRGRVERAITWRRVWPGLAGGGGLLVAAVVALHMGGRAPVAELPVPTPAETPALTETPPAAASSEALDAARVPETAPRTLPAPRPETHERLHRASPSTEPGTPAVAVEDAPPTILPELPSLETAVATAAPRPTLVGDLDTQTRAFEAAEDALAGGDGDRARGAYDAYLARWPKGAFAPEARLGALRAEVLRHDDEEVAALAAELLADPGFAPRRAELVRTRAGALARLGRCPEALALEGLGRQDAAEIRRACR